MLMLPPVGFKLLSGWIIKEEVVQFKGPLTFQFDLLPEQSFLK